MTYGSIALAAAPNYNSTTIDDARGARRPAKPSVRRTLPRLTFTLLAIDFPDELVGGSRWAAWPLIRRGLSLSYADIGLRLAVPNIFANIIEPPLALSGDMRDRRAVILTDGVCFALLLFLVAQGTRFASLLPAFVLF